MPLPGFALRRTVPEVDGEFPAAAGRPKVGAWLRRALLPLPLTLSWFPPTTSWLRHGPLHAFFISGV